MNLFKKILKLTLGLTAGYFLAQLTWVFWQLVKADPRFTLLVPQNKAPKGVTSAVGKTEATYTIQHVIEDGIERISYIPKERRFETPILMQHGMFHGAWCWGDWQALLAQLGWESHAISLPGHAKSPLQRPIHKCTLDYYLGFLRDEVKKLPRKPVLMGHSMGGALTQWYLKYVGQLPAAVFVSSWVADSALLDGTWRLVKQDPAIVPLMMASWDSSSWIRSPQKAAEKFLGPRAVVTPEELHARLGPESAIVLLQHNPPFYSPPTNIRTPSLWLAGELDAVVSVPGLRKSATHFGGDFAVIPEAGHNLMMEYNARETAETIHDWLAGRGIG